jgi:hypothetical protein
MNKIKFTLGLISVLAVLLFVVLTGLYFYLPHFLESQIIPQLAAGTGISEFAFNVRNIGIFGSDLGALRIGSPQNPALLIQSVQIDYSPKNLYQKTIKRITLSGIELHAEFKNGKFILRGIDLEKVLKKRQPSKETKPASDDSQPPLFLRELRIRSSVAVVAVDDRSYRVPFEINAFAEDPAFNLLNVTASVFPRGQQISADAKIDLKREIVIFKMAAVDLDLCRFSDFVQTDSDLRLSGKADMEAAAQLQLAPFKISSFDASAQFQKCKIRFNDFLLQNALNADEKELPFRIDLAKISDNEWQVNGSALSTTSPVPLTISGWSGRVKASKGQLESTGQFSLALPPSSVIGNKFHPIEVLESKPLPIEFSAEYRQDENLQFKIKDSANKKSKDNAARFRFDGYQIAARMPVIDISGKGTFKQLSTAFMIRIPGVFITDQSETVQLPQLVLKGTAGLNKDNDYFPKAEFTLQLADTRMMSKAARITIPAIKFSGGLKRKINGPIEAGGLLRITGAGLELPEEGVKISGGRGAIPLKWPPERQKNKGDIKIVSLNYKNLNLGEIKGDIGQTASGFEFEGRHISRLVPRMPLNFSGNAKLFGTKKPTINIQFKLLHPADGAEIDLATLMPQYEGIYLNGEFTLTGELSTVGTEFNGSAHLEVQNTSVRAKKGDFSIEGIQMSLSIPELPKIRSAPGQYALFSKISLGDLKAEDGRIDFQIESARKFLIEKTHFVWCNGNVDTQSMRISAGVEDYRITFYCDRLNLAKVLGQFGAAAAEGGGTVSGRIPVQYENGKISFNDGVLFSSPGKGGKIYLRGTEILTAGITPGTPQYVQMELAREALKDYDYSWAKLNITSEGEELLLQMQMDGKPAKLLPFVYSKEVGRFFKVEAGVKGSEFQGIRLDVNFRLPLNKMLQYKGLIKMIQ